MAAAEASPPAAAFKVYVRGDPRLCVALVPSQNRLVFRAADPADPDQRWERNLLSDNSFELVNGNSRMSIMNAHILPPSLVRSAHFHPRLLCATARWEEGLVAAGDAAIDIVCVSVMGNHYLALRIAPWEWDQDHQGNDETGALAVHEVSDDDGAGAGAEAREEDDAAATTRRSRCYCRLRGLFPLLC